MNLKRDEYADVPANFQISGFQIEILYRDSLSKRFFIQIDSNPEAIRCHLSALAYSVTD